MTKEIVEKIINESITTKTPEKVICEKYGISQKILYYNKIKFGIMPNPMGNAPCTARSKRVNDVDDDFFETPNLINCYYAGFYAADGNIAQNKRNCSIVLATKDSEWLEIFAKEIKFKGEIKRGVMREKFTYVSLFFTSSKIANDLNKNFNITPKKSLTLQHPNINDERLVDAFICGYIDGDGSIGLNKTKHTQETLRISILGTFDICLWIQKRFSQITGIENVGCICRKKGTLKNTYSYTVVNKTARKIFEHFYAISLPKLKRKWSDEKHEHCINFKKRLPLCRRKGVNIFNLNGELIKFCETLKDAKEYTGVAISTISRLATTNNNKHQANGYMFSRDKTVMEAYEPSKHINKKYLERERGEIDAGNVDMEMADAYGQK